MGFLDALLGKRKISGPAPDRLFALSTAYVDLEAAHGIASAGGAGIVFQQLGTGDFEQIVKDTEELLQSTSAETGTTATVSDDAFGYKWIVVRDDDLEDLVVAVNTVSDGLQVGGYADRVLAAVFAFDDPHGKRLYLIYNYKRGSWYPFVPGPGDKERDTERELQLKAQIGAALPVERELERWFPLWGAPI